MTTVKQICLGVAVAGAVVGAGSAVGTAVANAEPTASDSRAYAAAAADKPSGTSLGPARKATRNGTAGKPGMKARTEVPKLSQRLSAAVETARSAKDRDIDAPLKDVGGKFAHTIDSIAEATTNLGRTVQVRVADAKPPQPLVSRKTAKAITDSLAAVPKLPTPRAPSLPTPLLPMTVAGASTPVGSTTRQTASTPPSAVQTTAAPRQRVLVIGIDGTNLGSVLEDPDTNDNFIRIMNSGTTSVSSIAGHTTMSNPSWTAILTGVWDNKSGVINNVFTPGTYDRWPTLFDQLEGANPALVTKVIADWDVVAGIGGAGRFGADDVEFIGRVEGDTDWSQTDAKVTEETIKAIRGEGEEIPDVLFTYLVQVDEAGHANGGDSREYAAAIARTDENLGAILDAVAARETASCAAGACEEWTVIVVTDHGHQPQQSLLGHGFQSPRETSAFVIADGPGFKAGEMNTGYEIVDVTPTVVKIFGIQPTRDADGVPLQDQGATQVKPENLQQALKQQIASYGWPDPGTTLALTVRTVVATVPYAVVLVTNEITAQLQDIAGQDIFLVSTLAAASLSPIQLIGDGLYAVTDVISQIVGQLTGAGVIPPSGSTVQPRIAPELSIAV